MKIQKIRVFLEAVPGKKDYMHAAVAHIEFGLPGKVVTVTHKAKDAYTAIQSGMSRAIQAMHKIKERRVQRRAY